MKHILILLLAITQYTISFSQQIRYSEYFDTAALRVDYIHSGTKNTEAVSFVRFVRDDRWAGNPDKLICEFEYGKYRVEVFDAVSNKLIYSYGYCSLFEEWQTTDEATLTNKAFGESIVIPFPLKAVRIELFSVQRDNSKTKIFTFNFNQSTEFELVGNHAQVNTLLINGSVEHSIDVAVVADGYSLNERGKFESEADFLVKYLLSDPAFKDSNKKFNIHLVFSPSLESGCDIPGKGLWLNTVADSRFYTFGSDRYLTTASYHKLRDLVSKVPCDQIIIIANSNIYGGGGIYNFYSIASGSNLQSAEVLVHEFGHAFAALGDEYYTSETSYNDFYDLNHEPYQPNLTTLVDFDSKWKNMIDENVPIPTPLDVKFKNKTGVFEGGGYVEKGIYRPAFNCKMKELSSPFCKVCSRAIMKMIDYYCEP
ncbi:MAG TPA: M64 family metallopeptidase [Bacteroidales bacterium]|nr:M64 family metallopeptidase [Bacteroidales bacterium]